MWYNIIGNGNIPKAVRDIPLGFPCCIMYLRIGGEREVGNG